MTDLDFSALPSSLCFFLVSAKLNFIESTKKDDATKDAHVGFCFATVESQEFNFGAESYNTVARPSVTRQAQTLSQKFTRFSTGPTYALRLSNALSVGASVHASLTNHRSLLSASAATYGTTGSPIASSFYGASKGNSFQVEATVGAALRFGKQTVALSFRSPTAHVYGVGGVNRQTHYEGAGSETSLLTGSGTFVSGSPMRIGLGTGVEGSWGELEVDAFYFHPLGTSYRANVEGTETVLRDGALVDQPVKLNLSQPSRGIVNLAAGAEIFMSPRISMLTGFSTDVSAAPSGSLRGTLFNYYAYQQNHVTGSLGLGSHGTNGEIMLGAELSYGWGNRLAVNSYQLPPTIGTTDFSTYQFMLIVAGSTSLRAIKRVVEDMKKVVNDPTPMKPATTPTPHKPAKPEPGKPLTPPMMLP